MHVTATLQFGPAVLTLVPFTLVLFTLVPAVSYARSFLSQGAYFLSFGAIDWQWSSLNRNKVADRHGPASKAEVALIYECLVRGGAPAVAAAAAGGGAPQPCEHARFSFAANGTVAFEVKGDETPKETVAFLESLSEKGLGWVRVETTGGDDFLYEGQARSRIYYM